MNWPGIFFKTRKPTTPGAELPPPFKPASDNAAADPQPPTIKPVPAALGPQPATAKPEIGGTGPRTLTATHGVVLRPPSGLTTLGTSPQAATPRPAPTEPTRSPLPMKNIEQLMMEADPVKTLRQTGNIRILKPLTGEHEITKESKEAPPAATSPSATPPSEPAPARLETMSSSDVQPPVQPATAKVETKPSEHVLPSPKPVLPDLPSTPPPFVPPFAAVTVDLKKSAAVPAALTATPLTPPIALASPVAKSIPQPPPPAPITASPVSAKATDPEEDDSPFILKPATTPGTNVKIIPPTAPTLSGLGSIFRRKAKMTDVARIVLPPKREEPDAAPHVSTEASPTVVPPAFPVVAMTARANQSPSASQKLSKTASLAPAVNPVVEKILKQPSAPTPIPVVVAKDAPEPKPEIEVIKPNPDPKLVEADEPKAKTEPASFDQAPEVSPPMEKTAEAESAPNPSPVAEIKEEKPAAPVVDSGIPPKVDPEAHKPEPSAADLPKVDPEAHKPPPTPALPIPSVALTAPSEVAPREKREFHLANGERVAGVVLSETPEAVYVEHSTLGVITIPRANIAKRLVEIILINGDRIVGDIMAETADTLYVRHASLGMLTVPRAQRSTRVVEAILKDGDRILGEVLTETDAFTVIRSATLGTITVPHDKMAMLNRKIEQIELKALPPPAPEVKDKPAS